MLFHFIMIMAASAMWAMAFVPARADETGELAPPIKVLVAGRPLDVQGEAHAAPFVGDVNGDGLKDLLVGQYDGGKLRVYRNAGTKAEPRFEGFTWFKEGAEAGCVPFG